MFDIIKSSVIDAACASVLLTFPQQAEAAVVTGPKHPTVTAVVTLQLSHTHLTASL
jgi:hypothetical protein